MAGARPGSTASSATIENRVEADVDEDIGRACGKRRNPNGANGLQFLRRIKNVPTPITVATAQSLIPTIAELSRALSWDPDVEHHRDQRQGRMGASRRIDDGAPVLVPGRKLWRAAVFSPMPSQNSPGGSAGLSPLPTAPASHRVPAPGPIRMIHAFPRPSWRFYEVDGAEPATANCAANSA